MPVIAVVGAVAGAEIIGGALIAAGMSGTIGTIAAAAIGGAIGGGIGGGLGSMAMGGDFDDGFKSGAIGGLISGGLSAFGGLSAGSEAFTNSTAASIPASQLAAESAMLGVDAASIAADLASQSFSATDIVDALGQIGVDYNTAASLAQQSSGAITGEIPGAVSAGAEFETFAYGDMPSESLSQAQTPTSLSDMMKPEQAAPVEGVSSFDSGMDVNAPSFSSSPIGTQQSSTGGLGDLFNNQQIKDLTNKLNTPQGNMAIFDTVSGYQQASQLEDQARQANQPYAAYEDYVKNPQKYWGADVERASRGMARAGRTGTIPALTTQMWQQHQKNAPQMYQNLSSMANQNFQNMAAAGQVRRNAPYGLGSLFGYNSYTRK